MLDGLCQSARVRKGFSARQEGIVPPGERGEFSLGWGCYVYEATNMISKACSDPQSLESEQQWRSGGWLEHLIGNYLLQTVSPQERSDSHALLALKAFPRTQQKEGKGVADKKKKRKTFLTFGSGPHAELPPRRVGGRGARPQRRREEQHPRDARIAREACFQGRSAPGPLGAGSARVSGRWGAAGWGELAALRAPQRATRGGRGTRHGR
jgi:hypothetical protein